MTKESGQVMEVARLRAVHVRNALPRSRSAPWNQTSILFVICARERGKAEQRILYVSSLKRATLNPDWCVIMHDKRPRYFSNSRVHRFEAEEWILVFGCDGEGSWELLKQLKVCKEHFSYVGKSLDLCGRPYNPNSVVLELEDGFYVGLHSTTNAADAPLGMDQGDSLSHSMVHGIFERLARNDPSWATMSDVPSIAGEEGAPSYVDSHNELKGTLPSGIFHQNEGSYETLDAAVARALSIVRRVRRLRRIEAQTRDLSARMHSTLEKQKKVLELSLACTLSKNKVSDLRAVLVEKEYRLRETNALKGEKQSIVALWTSTLPQSKELLDSSIRNLGKAESIMIQKGGFQRLSYLQHMVALWRSAALSNLSALFRVQSNIVDEAVSGHDLHLCTRAPHEIRFSICGIDLEPMVWHYIFDIYLQWGGEGQERMERMSTALGYAAVVAKLASNYLDMRLQFSLYPLGSHSFLTDRLPRLDELKGGNGVSDSLPRLYPLYVDHSEKGAFTQAVYLFNRDLHQILDVLGLGHYAQKQSFSNLHVLLCAARKAMASPMSHGS